MQLQEDYNRKAAVAYAHQWAYGRNPAFYDYEDIGGDCTNFASQCLYAGSGIMNFLPTYGWYYINANRKSPSWTGVQYLYNFLARKQLSVGPAGRESGIAELLPGDLLQISFDGTEFTHTPVVVAAESPFQPENILLAAHSYDADYRPLSTYEYQKVRFIHMIGVVRP